MDSEEQDLLPAASRKRKTPADHVDGDGRAIKHRASQACQSCRTRKVRCDVLTSTSRCTNCRLDQLECVVVASRRGRNRRGHNKQKQQQNNQSHKKQCANATKAVRESGPVATTALDAWTAPDGSVSSLPTCVTFDHDASSIDIDNDELSDSINVAGHQPQVADDTATNISPSTTYVDLLMPDIRPDNNLQSQQGAAEQTPLPAFITPLSSHIPREDLEFLMRKGALTVPEPDLQVEILRAYLFSVHPFMPILDYRAFVHAVLSNRPDNRVSLLLFQAVMFAGLHSLPQDVIHRLGFESAKQARVVFFNRIRLLYEFDVTPDMAATLQSLVLMSSWYSRWDARRDTWYWTGQAYDVARRMGLHREPTATSTSEKLRHFRRRLWWSLYMRDRMIALGTRRPMRIYDSDCDVAMLTLEDFDLEPFDECHQGQPLAPGAKGYEATARMCIQLAKLCIHIGHVVSSQYTTQDRQVPPTAMVVSRRDERRAEELESCDRELSAWFDESCNNVQPTASPNAQTDGSHSCSSVHWAVLNITYHTTVNVLHRTQALQPISHTADARAVQNSSKLKVKRSARSLTQLSHYMLRRDQLRFLSLIGVTAIIAAYLSHMLDITSVGNDDDDVRDAGTFRLYQSLEVLQAFRNIYASADAALSFLASVSQKAGVTVPMQAAGCVSVLPTPREGPVSRVNHVPGLRTAQAHFRPGSQFSAVTPLVNRQQQQQPLDRDDPGFTINSGLATQPNIPATALTTLSNNTQVSNPGPPIVATSQHGNPQFVDTIHGGLPSSTSDWNSLLDLDIGIDSNLGNSMDLGPTSFNHDFYIDAFGLTESHLSSI